MGSIVSGIVLALVGWGCMVQSILVAAGRPPIVALDGRALMVVQVVACLFALRLCMKAAALLGRIGLFLGAAPLFGLAGVVGFGLAGLPGALVGALVPAIITWKWGLMGLGATAVLAVLVGVASF